MSVWISVDDELPAIGQKVIVFSNGVVQEEVWALDTEESDGDTYGYFWARDDSDECPDLKRTDMWQPLPEPPKETK